MVRTRQRPGVRARGRITVLAATVALLASGPGTAATAAVPATAATPTGTADPGEPLTVEPTAFRPDPLRWTDNTAWHLTYASTSATGEPNVVSGTVIVPDDGRGGPDRPRPLVTYAVGTVGLGDQCAPSAGFPHGTALEAGLIQRLLDRGWAVAVTDYEGLGTPGIHTYAVGRAEGHAVLDAARAALRLPDAAAHGVTDGSPIGIMGYSQGGQAASWAAELHRAYAPELGVVGTAAGGVPAELLDVAESNEGGTGAGLVLMAAIGHDAAFPELDLDGYLTPRGRAYTAFMTESCVALNTRTAPIVRIDDVTVANPLATAAWQARLAESRLGTSGPGHPVYLYHGLLDELIPHRLGAGLRQDWCARGATVRWRTHRGLKHLDTVLAGSAPAADWLADRFGGRPAGGNCR